MEELINYVNVETRQLTTNMCVLLVSMDSFVIYVNRANNLHFSGLVSKSPDKMEKEARCRDGNSQEKARDS